MEKLDLQAIAGSRLSFRSNEHIALFSDFEEVRGMNISDVLIEGFLFAMVIMAGVRGKLGDQDGVPEAFKGVPIVLITAAIIVSG